MANAGPDTNNTDFFVTIGAQRSLDFNQEIWGQLVRGFDVLKTINNVPTTLNSDGSTHSPVTPVFITSASIVQDTTDQVLTIKAPAGQSSNITVTVNDGHGGTDSKSFTATAVADSFNDPPFLGPVPNITTTQGSPVTFTLTGMDLENDPLMFEALEQDGTTTNANVQVSGANVTVTPNAGFTGTINLLVGVADQGATSRGSAGTNVFDTQKMTVSVLTVTGRPITVRPNQAINNAVVAVLNNAPSTAQASQFSAAIDWGDGTTTAGGVVSGANGTFLVTGTHTYTTTGTFVSKITVTDNGNPSGVPAATASTTNSVSVITTDAPIHAQATNLSAAEGLSTGNVTVAGFTSDDPTVQAADFTASINWGDGSSSQVTPVAGPNFGFNVISSHTYAKANTYTVTTTITHTNVPSGVTGSTAAPQGTATVTTRVQAQGGNITVGLGTAINGGTIATFTDADTSVTANSFSAAIDWGDGTKTPNATIVARNDGSGLFNVNGTHTYTTAGTFTATVTITELAPPTGATAETVTAQNTITVAQRLTAQGGAITAGAGVPLSGATIATFQDLDTTAPTSNFTTTIDWGDGTTTAGVVTGGVGSFNVTGSHTYSTVGTFTANVTITELTAPNGTPPETVTATNTISVVTPVAVTGQSFTVNAGTALTDALVATFTASNTAAQASDFNASINWGDNTTTSGTVASFGGGTFGVTGSHTYASPGTFSTVTTVTVANGEAGTVGSSASGTGTITVVPGPTATQRFVIKLYEDLLGRPPDLQALNTVTALLDQGKLTRATAAQFVTSSREYDAFHLNQLYGQLLGKDASGNPRVADGPAQTAFVNFLQNGGRWEDVERTTLASQEYFSNHGSTNDAFVSAAYMDVLNRPADNVGKSDALAKLGINGTRDQLATTLITSAEGRQARVTDLFQTMLNVSDPTQAQAFLKTLPATDTDVQLVDAVAASDQNFQKAQSSSL
jgi:hypothetical protein